MNRINALLIADNPKSCWQLKDHLERAGFCCRFAATSEQVTSLLKRYSFQVVLSTRPVTADSPLAAPLYGRDCQVFYSRLVEKHCLWFQAVFEGYGRIKSLWIRPSELASALDDLARELMKKEVEAQEIYPVHLLALDKLTPSLTTPIPQKW
jgi:hypothetical protein